MRYVIAAQKQARLLLGTERNEKDKVHLLSSHPLMEEITYFHAAGDTQKR